MNVGDFLKANDRPVITIGPNEMVNKAIQKLVDNNIGVLPVCDAKGSVLGIISERDFLRLWHTHKGAIGNIQVKDMMTKDLVIGIAEDDLDYVVNVMIQKGVRHMPIMAGPKLEGIISMRDIINVQLTECRAQVRILSDYISPSY